MSVTSSTTSPRGRRRQAAALASALAVCVGSLTGCALLLSAPLEEPAPPASSGSRSVLVTAGKVVRVADGDTVTVQTATEKMKVRLLGIDAPEIAHGSSPADCGGPQAAAALRALVKGRKVTLSTDAHAGRHDRFGRVLGYLDLHGRDVALQLITDGHASPWLPKGAPKPSRWATYVAAGDHAAAERRGSWATCTRLGRPQTS